ncbi:hypothetical protein [Spirosoma sp.]|uniref:hypothetical protein n=1 Tax=Spirosoma sp. TaxID=1899569 RepID=UPI00261F31EA|nr:hypothetical protein [Spirosoma sp.]MCX6218357.1 hypothetical protein [Spirosoma sp.]
MFNAEEFAKFMGPFLAKMLGLTLEQVQEKASTEDGAKELETLYSTKVYKGRHSAGMGEAQKKLNKALKDTFGIDVDETADIPAAIAALKDNYTPEPVDDKDKTLSDAKFKADSRYITIEQRATKAESEAEKLKTDFDTRVNNRIAELNLQQKAESALTELKAILPTHEGQKKLLVDQYRNSFTGISEKTENGQTYYFEGDKRLEDQMGVPLTWEQIRQERASQFFEFEAPDRDSSGAKKEGGNPPAGPKKVVNLQPRTKDALNTILEDDSIELADQQKARDFFDSLQRA